MNNKNIITVSVIVIFIMGSIFLINSSEKRLSTEEDSSATTAVASSPSAVIDFNTPDNCRTIINNEVYDLTEWIARHPGGSQAIISLCGEDGTEAFMRMHGNSENAISRLESFKVID